MVLCFSVFLALGFAQVDLPATATKSSPAGDVVVARVDSQPVTIDDLTALARATGNLEQLKTNPREFLSYYAFCVRLLSYAEANHLDQEALTQAAIETQKKTATDKGVFGLVWSACRGRSDRNRSVL